VALVANAEILATHFLVSEAPVGVLSVVDVIRKSPGMRGTNRH
jgi:hypothetical protein